MNRAIYESKVTKKSNFNLDYEFLFYLSHFPGKNWKKLDSYKQTIDGEPVLLVFRDASHEQVRSRGEAIECCMFDV